MLHVHVMSHGMLHACCMPGPLGIAYEGRRVTSVKPGGQTDRSGVRVGMWIDQIDGESMPDDSSAIHDQLKSLKDRSLRFVVRFSSRKPSDSSAVASHKATRANVS